MQLHNDALEDSHALGNVQQVEDDLLVVSKDISLADHVQQRVADLASGTGDDDTNRFSLRERERKFCYQNRLSRR